MRYEIMANTVIKIDLHNNYSVVAFAKWNVETEKYSVDLYIKDNTIDHFDLLDDYKNIILEEYRKNIADAEKHNLELDNKILDRDWKSVMIDFVAIQLSTDTRYNSPVNA